MKSSLPALALFFFLLAFAAKPSLAARHEPCLTDGKELRSEVIVSALKGVVEDGPNLVTSAFDCPRKYKTPWFSFFLISLLKQLGDFDHFWTKFNFLMKSFTGKSSWPELVGKNGEVAAAIIEKENPCVHAIVLLEGTPVTKDYRIDRVRVWVNKKGKVIRVPRIGWISSIYYLITNK